MSLNAKLVSITIAILLAVGDLVLTFSVGGMASKAVGAVEIFSALGLQAALVLFSWIWIRHRGPSTAALREPASYRAVVPLTPIGILLLGSALSLSLLYVGLVCPGEGLPMVRGRGFCT